MSHPVDLAERRQAHAAHLIAAQRMNEAGVRIRKAMEAKDELAEMAARRDGDIAFDFLKLRVRK